MTMLAKLNYQPLCYADTKLTGPYDDSELSCLVNSVKIITFGVKINASLDKVDPWTYLVTLTTSTQRSAHTHKDKIN